MTRPVLYINGEPVPAGPRYVPPTPPGPPQRPGCYPSCCGVYGSGNGGHAEPRLGFPGCEYAPARFFDHLDGSEPECAVYSRVAREMRRGRLGPGEQGPLAWWETVPEWSAPEAVTGEVADSREIRRMAALEDAIYENARAAGMTVQEYAGKLLRAARRKADKR